MQYQSAGADFYNSLYDFLKNWERVEFAPYDAKDGVITIGLGFNITAAGSNNLRTSVLRQLGIKVDSLASSTE